MDEDGDGQKTPNDVHNGPNQGQDESESADTASRQLRGIQELAQQVQAIRQIPLENIAKQAQAIQQLPVQNLSRQMQAVQQLPVQNLARQMQAVQQLPV